MNQHILRSVCIDLGIHSLSDTLSGNSQITVYRSVRGGDTAGFRKYEVNEKNIKHALKMQAMILHRIAPAPLPVDEPVTFAGVDESMSIHFVNGDVDYIEPGALIDNDMDEFPF